jgi:hypothetical protein
MGNLLILDSDHAAFKSGIMTRRRSRNIFHDGISANSQVLSKVICSLVISYKATTKIILPNK